MITIYHLPSVKNFACLSLWNSHIYEFKIVFLQREETEAQEDEMTYPTLCSQ